MRNSLFLLCLFWSGWAFAQERTITGKVTSSDDGSALPGVSVSLQGTSRGTTTNLDGEYSIDGVGNNTSLVFSFVGFNSKTVEVAGRTKIDVALDLDNVVLDELVVVGYGVQKKSKLTSSIARVDGKDLANLTTASVDQQLAGRAAGVQVTVGSGLVGQAPRIRVRGVNSITSGASPLIVIDGVPAIDGNQGGSTSIQTNPLADINPDDIESIEVLKDGAATAIYGSRAANGVVLVSTKKGKKDQPLKVTLGAQFGWTNAINRFDLLNAEQFVEIANEKIKNLSPTAEPQAFLDNNRTNTDWQDVILRQGKAQNYSLGFSGGKDKTNYYFSVGYNDIQGAVVSSEQKRYSFTGNLDHNLSKVITLGTKMQYSRTENSGLNSGSNSLSGNIANAARLFPNVPIYSDTHPTGYNISPDGAVLGSGANTRNIDNNYTNIQFVMDNNKHTAKVNRILSASYIQLNLFDGFTLKSQLGIDLSSTKRFLSWDPRHGDGRGSNGVVTSSLREVNRWNWQNTANYIKEFGQHSVNVTLGTEYQKEDIRIFGASASNFSDRFFQQENLISGSFTVPSVTGSGESKGFDSYFGRVMYDYGNKYFLTFSARNDGLSSLPAANRRGNFFGGSVGYKISEEDFFKNSSIGTVVNNLKIRASLAQVGNTDFGAFPYLGTFGAAQYGSQNGIGFTRAGNPNLKWESSTQTDIGLDLGLWADRVVITADYFKNDVNDLILYAPTAASLGVPDNNIAKNVGSMYNKGFEFAIDYKAINKKDFGWNVNFNISTVRNKVLSLNKGLDGKDQDIFPSAGTATYHVIRAGEAIASLYGYQSAGVNSANGFPLFEKGNGALVQRNVYTGTYSFYDSANPSSTTNTTGAALSAADVANGGDRRVLGQVNPTWFGAITNSLRYKGFDFEVFSRFSGGNKIMNITRQETLLNYDFSNNGTEILNRWTGEGQVTDVPVLALNRGNFANMNGNTISRFVESANFFRIQNISLGYTFPKTVNNAMKIGLSSLRIYGSVQNAFTFTKYSGLDPELNAQGDVNQTYGLDYNTNPQFRVVSFGLNASF